MSEIFTSTAALALKETLEDIDTDEKGAEWSGATFSKWLTVKNMTDNYVEYYEIAGTGLAGEKPEGESYPVGGIVEGPLTRFNARTYGQRLIVSEEAIEDLKYDKVVQAAKRNNRSLVKLAEVDSTLILKRATNTAFVGADGQPLASLTHLLPNGSTYSNMLATAMSPSKAALVIARAQLAQQVGHDGLIDKIKPVKIVHPPAQWGVWGEVLESTYDPTPGAFNAINVANRKLNITPIENEYWDNTTTNWTIITDVELGLMWLWRRKPKSNTWTTEDKTMLNYAISARWSRGWVNARSVLFSNA